MTVIPDSCYQTAQQGRMISQATCLKREERIMRSEKLASSSRSITAIVVIALWISAMTALAFGIHYGLKKAGLIDLERRASHPYHQLQINRWNNTNQ
jgi:hypothetical protein